MRKGAILASTLLAFGLVWFLVGLGPLHLGPSEWDDALYCNHAALGTGHWYLRNRYAHMWLLRIAFELTGSRPLGATLLPLSLVVGTAWVAFFYGRKLGGTACGVLSLLLVPLYAPLLKYLTVPHVDITMAFFSLLAIASAWLSHGSESSWRMRTALVVSGFASFFAIESKETGLAAPPVALYLIWQLGAGRRKQAFACFALGAALGLGTLATLDALFKAPGLWWSANPLQYFGNVPRAYARAATSVTAPAADKTSRNFVEHLTYSAYFAFTLLGLAGAARGFRRSLGVRALFLWWLGLLACTSLVSWISPNIQAYDRYLVAPGVALVLLTTYHVVELWKQGEARSLDQAYWIVPLAGFLVWVSGRALYLAAVGRATSRDQSALVFMLPVLMLLLFLTPWLSESRLLSRTAPALLLCSSLAVGVVKAGEHVVRTRAALAPWHELVREADERGAVIAVWQARKTPESRVRWRVRALSRRAADEVAVRKIRRLRDARLGEILFTQTRDLLPLRTAGYRRIAHHDDGRGAWSAHVRP